MPMRCACEYDEATRKVLGFCGAHAARARIEQEAERRRLKEGAAKIAKDTLAYTEVNYFGDTIAERIMREL